ncbi:hypothetical protein T439DRAFT_352583 [Meredithblackwellia eburnea MCA 4105]
MSIAIRDSIGSLRGSGYPLLNWLFLVENIVVVILVIFIFFYLNRVFGVVLAALIRFFTWRWSNAYIDVGSLQFSLLGGKIVFSDLRYISRNQSFRIIEGRISWRYWLWRVRSEEDLPSEARLPCRISVSMSGVEWFLYNRTPSYDDILQQFGMQDHDPLRNPESSVDHEVKQEDLSLSSSPLSGQSPTSADHLPPQKEVKTSEGGINWRRELFPIDILCKTGSIILGNPSTANILIAGFDKASGALSAVKPRSPLDKFKDVYHFTFEQPKIVFRSNPDYTEGQVKHGEKTLEKMGKNPAFNIDDCLRRPPEFATLTAFRTLLRGIPRPKKGSKTADSTTPPSTPWEWQGLPRYQASSEENSEGEKLPHRVEYGKVTTLLVTPELELTYYCDDAGLVPITPRVVTGFAGLETCDIGNGDLSPEWGVDMVIKGGVVTYGPWADRQRSELQQAFFPATFFNQKATTRLKPGDTRLHAALKVFVEFSQGTTFRIPTREVSKDWKYSGIDASNFGGSMKRPYGWLDVALGPNSTLSYVLPAIYTSAGYETLVELHLDEVSVTSSVNYAVFLRSETCRIHCGLPAPLVWDELRTWAFDVTLSKPDVSLLRDHITLFTDIAKDWVSGPPGDYNHFVPFKYAVNFSMIDYTLRLFVNDHNIINNPSTLEDNSLIVVRGPKLSAIAAIPSDKYRMQCSLVEFKLNLLDLVLAMTLPDWNTHNAFLTDNTRTFATTPELIIDGSYRFYAEADPDHVERLALAVSCQDVVFKTMGWMVRHMFNLRDNYFGTFTHFVTLEEYRHRHERDLQGDPLELKYRPGATDVFEVVVTLDLRNGMMLLPQELYDCRSAVVLLLPQFSVDLRNHDFYMEMTANVDPFRIIEAPDAAVLIRDGFTSAMERSDSVLVEGLEITANRLFGPQPRTATYMCIWSIYLGSVVGSIPPTFLTAFGRAAGSVGSNFVDQDNSLPADFAVQLDPDATFVTVNLTSLDLAIRGNGTAVQLALEEGVSIRFDDLATEPFLQHIDVDLPVLTVRFLAPLFGRAAPWMEVASLDADFSIILGLSKDGWLKRSREQLSFIERQDALTNRCPFIYGQRLSEPSHVGSLYLPALANPSTVKSVARRGARPFLGKKRSPFSRKGLRAIRRSSSGANQESDDDESDTSSDDDGRSDSDTSEDDYAAVYSRLPGRSEPGDRFSAYGAILQLCQRAPEAAFMDRPTFHRLPSVSPSVIERTSTQSINDSLPSLAARLGSFDPPTQLLPHSRTAVDVLSRHPIRIVVTPVAVQVAADVLSGLPEERNFEHILDDLMDTYFSRQSLTPAIRFSSTDLRASIPSIQIEAIQDVLRPEETILIRPGKDDDGQSGSTVLCTVRLTLDDITVSMRQTVDAYGSPSAPDSPIEPFIVERRFAAVTRSNRLQVFHPSRTGVRADSFSQPRRNHTLPSVDDKGRPMALNLHIATCEAKIDFTPSKGTITLVGGESRLDFVDEAAELVIGSIWSWRAVQDVAGLVGARSTNHEELTQHLLWAIVRTSEDSSITTFPIFLNRVSYLVGNSSNLRADDGWKILHHLRHCLRAAEEDVGHVLVRGKDWAPPHEIMADVVEALGRWRGWELDADDLTKSPLLTTVFALAPTRSSETSLSAVERHRMTATPSWNMPISFEWRAGRFDALLSDGSRSLNRLAIGPIETFVRSTPRGEQTHQHQIKGRITLHDLDAQVDRDLLLLIRHILGVRRTFERKIQVFRGVHLEPVDAKSGRENSEPDFMSTIPNLLVDVSVGVRRVGAVAKADNLEARCLISDTASSISVHLEPVTFQKNRSPSRRIKSTTTFAVGSSSLALVEVATQHEDTFIALGLKHFTVLGDVLAIHTSDSTFSENPSLKLVVGTGGLSLSVLRDPVRLYDFIETWRTENLPTYDSLLNELRQGLDEVQATALVPARPAKQNEASPLFVSFLGKAHLSAQLAISLISFELQAVPTLKMAYFIRDISAYAATLGSPAAGTTLGEIDAGFGIGLQKVTFTATGSVDHPEPTVTSVTDFDLPGVRVKAHLDALPCRKLVTLATVDPISLKLTLSIIDSLLLVQGRFGSDIDDLVSLVRKKRALLAESERKEAPLARDPPKPRAPPGTALDWEGRLALLGLKIGIEGPQATQWVEANLIECLATSPPPLSNQLLRWNASVQSLTISLSQRSLVDSSVPLDKLQASRNRLAFLEIGLAVSNSPMRLLNLPEGSISDDGAPHLHVRVPRLHAVMQPSAVEALGDLVDYFEEEIKVRRSLRKQEVEAIRDRVIQTFEMAEQDPQAPSWITTCILSLEISGIGIAIPLSDEGIRAPDDLFRRKKSAHSRPAFLLSVAQVGFSARKGSAGQASVSDFSLQFVSSFDQSIPNHFKGSTHSSNLIRVRFPKMECTVRSPRNGPTLIHSDVDGIEIDLEPSVVTYTFSLLDVFTASHERFAKFATQVGPTPGAPASTPTPSSKPSSPILQTAPQSPIISTETQHGKGCLLTLKFKTGRVRLHSRPIPNQPSSSRSRPHHGRGTSVDGFGPGFLFGSRQTPEPVYDQFNLPGVDVWAEYRDEASSSLHVGIAILSSQNTVQPTAIPFITEVLSQLQSRAKRAPATSPATSPMLPAGEPTLDQPFDAAPFGQIKLSVGLKIGESILQVSCEPVRTHAVLKWSSGGFLLSMSPEKKGVDLVLQVDGVSVGIRSIFGHGQEYSVLAEAKGITTSLSFQSIEDPSGNVTERISGIVDFPDVTVTGSLRKSEQWLAFKAVWLDPFDDLSPSNHNAPLPTPLAPALTTPASPPLRITTIVLVQLRKLSVHVDLSPYGNLDFVASTIDGHLRWIPGDSRRFGVGIGRLEVNGKSSSLPIRMFIEGVLFETLLRDDSSTLLPSDLLHLRIALGKSGIKYAEEVSASRLLFDADPIEVRVDDDWSSVPNQLALDYKVKMGSFNLIATSATLPRIIRDINRVTASYETRVAEANSMLIKENFPPLKTTESKAREAVSAVASKFSSAPAGADSGCDVLIKSNLSIEAERFRIAIFPNHFNEGSVLRLDAGSIQAQLARSVDAQDQIHRDLKLHLGFFSLRYVTFSIVSPADERQNTGPQWYDLFRKSSEANIFKLPTTEITMKSEQSIGSNRIRHRFAMTYIGSVDVAFNWRLYKHLKDLSDAFKKEMSKIGVDELSSAKEPAPASTSKEEGTKDKSQESETSTIPSQPVTLNELPPVEDELVKMKLTPLGQKLTGESRMLEYETVEMNFEMPRLTFFGDMIPPVQIITAQQAKLPGWCHSGVTIPLEELLLALSSTYQNQLAKQKLSAHQPEEQARKSTSIESPFVNV